MIEREMEEKIEQILPQRIEQRVEQIVAQVTSAARQESREEGVLEGQRKLLLSLARLRFGAERDWAWLEEALISEAACAQWMVRLSSAPSYEALRAEP